MSKWALFLIVLAACLPGCAGLTSANETGVLTVALDQPPANLDPRIGIDASSERLFQIMFSSLVRKDEHAVIQPDAAESWDIPDPKTYVFHLRHDIKFHDGRPLTSTDVAYTFQTILNGSVRTAKFGTFDRIESIETPDLYTVVFHLKEVFAPF